MSKRELFHRQRWVRCAVLLLVQPVDESAHAEEGSPKDQRIADTAPKAMRQQMREETEKARAAL